jgi:hypothetical protein
MIIGKGDDTIMRVKVDIQGQINLDLYLILRKTKDY